MLDLSLELRDLSCERDDRVLFAGLCAQFNSGDVVQIEGPNGSGKTTLLKVLTTISNDYRGEIYWDRKPFSQSKFEFLSQLLFLGHLPGIKKALSPVENLLWYQRISGQVSKDRIFSALTQVGLAGYEDVPCYQLSAGQHRRAALSRLYLDPSPVWILDEPFTAIDKKGVAALERLIAERAEKGGLVILTTHQDINSPSLKKVNLQDFNTVEAQS